MSDYFEDTLGDEPDAAVVRWMDRPPLHVGAAALSSAVAGGLGRRRSGLSQRRSSLVFPRPRSPAPQAFT